GTALMPDPRQTPLPWELMSEMTVIVALFGAGMRIDRLGPWRRWRPTWRLLGIAMPLTIAAAAWLGSGLVGFTLAGAILLGAVLAPTDPVLASDVQVGPPQQGREHPVRFALTTEAGLNDGLAFPFVYLGLLVAAEGLSPVARETGWLVQDVLYRTVVVSDAVGRPGQGRTAELDTGGFACFPSSTPRPIPMQAPDPSRTSVVATPDVGSECTVR
ncbi:cation:proton antiporter domain-containing protein, partial [Mangrovicoccus algicola]|nr:cation:proton antiporter [Mangrovicoccus algicola]